MKILLIGSDSKIPNLALMKLSAWHKQKKDIVGFDIPDPDKIYCSVVFRKNKEQAAGLQTMFPVVPIEFGGPGWDLQNKLPPEIEKIKPDYDLYPSTYSQGFTTRGCIRHCPFCIVPEKEGNIQIWQNPYQFYDDRFDTMMLMDNNLLAAGQDWTETVLEFFNVAGLKMLSQGWDPRLLTEETAGMLKDIKHVKGLQFSWDNIGDEDKIIKAIKILKDAGFDLKHDISFYVLAGYNTTFEQDLYRCNRLRELGVNSYVMPYHKKNRQINRLAKWANRRWAYWSGPFERMVTA